MSRRKHDRKWTTAAAAVALGCTPVAVLALDAGGGATFTTVAATTAGCPAPAGMPPLGPTAETVKGAPYSGVGTTEVVTTLGDGNRITRTNTMRYFRDSAGRMRTEYQLGAIGPFVPEDPQSIVTITDPVAGKRYVLSPARKRADVFDLAAEKGAQALTGKAIIVNGTFTSIGAAAPGLAPTAGFSPPPPPAKGFFRVFSQRSSRDAGASPAGPAATGPSAMMAPGFAGSGNRLTEAGLAREGMPATTAPPPPAPPPGDVFFVTNGPVGVGCAAGPNTKPAPQAVSIGERRIEGLKVTGSRLEFTIKAGEVGNEQPITVRTDQWFSADLGVVVASTHNDPMIGEQTYRLEQISRAEPDPALFTIPADYAKSSVER